LLAFVNGITPVGLCMSLWLGGREAEVTGAEASHGDAATLR
jgi:hypothetical protein